AGRAADPLRAEPALRARPRARPDLSVPTPPGLAAVRTALSPITSLGWTIGGLGAVSWWLGAQLGWEELLILAGACAVALTLGLLSTIGRLGLDIDVAVEPTRVVVGGDAVGQVQVTNARSRPMLGSR